MVVAIDARGVAIREADLYGVVADDRGGLGAWLGFEHRQRGSPRGCSGGKEFFFAALVVACSARTFFAQINEVVVAGVAVGPCDVHTSAGFDVHFHVRRFFSWVEWNRHARGRC